MSDRDQRHRFKGWMLARLPWSVFMNHRISFASPPGPGAAVHPLIHAYG